MSSICYFEDSVGQYWGNAINEDDGSNRGSDATLANMFRGKLLSNLPVMVNIPHTNTQAVHQLMNDGYSIILNGSPQPPVTGWSLDPLKEGRSSPGWGTSKWSGEICLTDYKKRTCSFNCTVAPIITPTGDCTIRKRHILAAVSNPDNSYSSSLFSGHPRSRWSTGHIVMGGKGYDGYVELRRKHGILEGWTSPYDDNLNVKTLRSHYTWVYQMLDDPSLVQGTVAAANERSLDLLTQVFELPETIISIGRSFLNVRSVIKNWNTRDALLRARKEAGVLGFDTQRSKIRREIDYLTYNLENYSGKHVRGMKSRLYKARKKLKSLNKQRKNFLQQIGDEMASAWLRLRYEILPNIYACQDLAESAEHLTRLYQTERQRAVLEASVPEFPGWEFKGEREVVWRCMVKYMYDTSGSLADIRKAMSANGFLTAWELGKLTFVLDWFFSVGDFLSARFGKPDLVIQDGVTLTQKCMINGIYTNTTTGAQVSVDYSHYQRQVVDAGDFSGIFPLINLNWQRLVDSSALLWGELRRHFKLK